ncbi:hypothetical protein U4960_15775 [Altererythrobacter sp. H2]|uniref:hypothetical protein n=1 Tax=Altererythrobacter sp. H2 TaxID=3108391 RepID=UPI002B4BECBE|nr:hypothetical protein [Altererythrobacter sp. H2]WRK95711.1 hypothetical protein U4960_15775 [Altererythrobacter sp. H2]
MGRFTVYLMGCAEGLPVELDATSVHDIEQGIRGSRFIAGELIDVPNSDGVFVNRAALIPISRLRMILEDD